ncbi:MAG TPA: Ig-like domain-containing protein [Solirubrobacteraceae bacterium]|jgi:hypothetical protein
MKGLKRAAAAILLVIASGTTMSGATFTASARNPTTISAAGDFLVHVSLADPGSPKNGTVNLSATATDTGGGTITSVTFQRSPAGAGTWTNACAPDTVSPYACALNTATLSDGLYDLRALAVDSLGTQGTSAVIANRQFDNGSPSVSMPDPGLWFRGTLSMTSTTSDPAGGTGVAQVRYEYKTTAGSVWLTACTSSSAPFTCSFATTGLTNGTGYDFHAVATDGAGNATTSAGWTNRKPDNAAPTATLTAPATLLQGTVSLAGTLGDTGGSGVASATFQYSPAGANTWSNACPPDTVSPYSCSWATTAVPDGLYDVRVVATDVAGNVTSSAVATNRRVDNTAPTVAVNDPGPYIRGTTALGATASDGNGSGILNVQVQYRVVGASTWTTACTDTTSPYSCTLFTNFMADNVYEVRAIATDNAGFTSTAATVTTRIDNGLPSVTMTNPGSPLSGSVSVSATASDSGSGVADVDINVRPAGGAWSLVCTDTTSPYSCTLDTTTLTDGVYELRAVATDAAGNARTSTAVTNLVVDNTPPTVALGAAGAWLGASTVLTATAGDGSGAGVSSVAFQYAPAGTALWSTGCTDTTAPYSCAVDGSALTNGAFYDVRAVATDGAGFSTASTVVTNRRVDNAAPTGVTMTDPGSPLTGTVAFSGDAADALSGLASITYQYWSGSAWVDICTAGTSPWSCSTSTAAVPDGAHDVRALAADQAANTTASATITSRMFDNTDPSVAVTDPGQYLRGSVVFAATASDGSGTGVTQVALQRSPAGTSTWTTICTDTSSPYACPAFDTTTLADGLYDFRAVALDGVSRTGTSATLTNRRVDNAPPATSVTDPGAYIGGTVAIDATGTDTGGSGVANVRIQRSPTGAGTWTDICTDTVSPYSCSWVTTLVADGGYDLRSIATDNAGNTTTSLLVTNRRVDNTAPTAVDVQTTNGGTTPGRIDTGDAIVFTYSEQVDPGTLVAGWNGTGTTPVTIHVDNKATNDHIVVFNAGNTAAIPLIDSGNWLVLGRDYASSNAVFSGTLAQSGATVTLLFGAYQSGGLGTPGGTPSMTWNPNASVLDFAGNATSTASVGEQGGADTDF